MGDAGAAVAAGEGGWWPRTTDLREVINAILYQNRTGCQYDMLPHDLPPKSTIYEYFTQWRDDGTWQVVLDVLRQGLGAVTAASESPDPNAASIDSQSVKTTEVGGERGYDGGQENHGRKRHIAVYTLVAAGSGRDDGVDGRCAAVPQVFEQMTSGNIPACRSCGPTRNITTTA